MDEAELTQARTPRYRGIMLEKLCPQNLLGNPLLSGGSIKV